MTPKRVGSRSSCPGAGVYLVEAVSPPQKAYTIVIVSDVGLVTKTAPGQALFFTANRFDGQARGGLHDSHARRSQVGVQRRNGR